MRTTINKNGQLTMRFLGFYKRYINISFFYMRIYVCLSRFQIMIMFILWNFAELHTCLIRTYLY